MAVLTCTKLNFTAATTNLTTVGAAIDTVNADEDQTGCMAIETTSTARTYNIFEVDTAGSLTNALLSAGQGGVAHLATIAVTTSAGATGDLAATDFTFLA